jgi:hypothetical protein
LGKNTLEEVVKMAEIFSLQKKRDEKGIDIGECPCAICDDRYGPTKCVNTCEKARIWTENFCESLKLSKEA